MTMTTYDDPDLTAVLQGWPTDLDGTDLEALTVAAVVGGARARLRRRTAGTALGVAGLLAVAAVAVPLSGGTATYQPTTLGPAASPAASPPLDPAQAAPYWHARLTDTITTQRDGKLVTDALPVIDFWSGHDRPSWSFTPSEGSRQSSGAFADRYFVGAIGFDGGNPLASNAVPGLGWDDMWSLPRTAAGLEAYYRSHETDARALTPLDLYRWAANFGSRPGPVGLTRAAADLMAAQPGVVEERGVDARGRSARILSWPLTRGQVERHYLDPETGTALEWELVSAGPTADHPDNPPIGVDQGRTLYDQIGPTQDHQPRS